MSQLNKTETLIQLFSQLFLVGTSEELFFRGLLTTWLMKRYPYRLAGLSGGVILVAFLFALVELHKLLFGFPPGKVLVFVLGALFYGLLLGGMYQKTKSLLAPIVIHNLGNSLMLLAGLGF
jgi:membrane protease YdiL (CAAX protease family)